jgi:hypothetical protein
MDCFSGEEAFDKVLEALLDAHHNARQASERQSDAELRAQEAERGAVNLQGKVHRLEQEQKNALPRLAELWQAASAILNLARTVDKGGGAGLTRLKTALDAARDYCDEIPF